MTFLSAVDVMKHPAKSVKLVAGELECMRKEVIMASFFNTLRHDVYYNSVQSLSLYTAHRV
jgi:hypothetical protein